MLEELSPSVGLWRHTASHSAPQQLQHDRRAAAVARADAPLNRRTPPQVRWHTVRPSVAQCLVTGSCKRSSAPRRAPTVRREETARCSRCRCSTFCSVADEVRQNSALESTARSFGKADCSIVRAAPSLESMLFCASTAGWWCYRHARHARSTGETLSSQHCQATATCVWHHTSSSQRRLSHRGTYPSASGRALLKDTALRACSATRSVARGALGTEPLRCRRRG